MRCRTHAWIVLLPSVLLALLVTGTTAHPGSAQVAATPIVTGEETPAPEQLPGDQPPGVTGEPEWKPPALRCDGGSDRDVPVGGVASISCSVELADREPVLIAVRSTSPAWAMQFDAIGASDTMLVAADDGPLPQTQPILLNVEAPATVDASTEIELAVESLVADRISGGSFTTTLTTIVPEDWTLACAPTSNSARPGTVATVTCSIPDPAWALRDGHPTAWHDVVVGDAADLGSSTFDLKIPVPCSAGLLEEDLPVTVVAHLAAGITLTNDVTIPLDLAADSLALGVGAVTVSEESSHLATLAVDLTVTGASTPCGDIPWTLRLTSLSLTRDGIAYQPVSIVSDGRTSSASTSLSTNANVNASPVLATGQGDGTIHLTLAITLPSDAPGGEYDGSLRLGLTPDLRTEAIWPVNRVVAARV